MNIIVKNMPFEVHHSIELVKRYQRPLCRIYTIILLEIPEIKPDLALQISFKAFNNLVKSNGFVSILLIFGIYFWMTEINASSLTITQYIMVMQKAMKKVWKLIASHQIYDILNIWNRSSTNVVYDLSLNSLLLVYQEGNIG